MMTASSSLTTLILNTLDNLNAYTPDTKVSSSKIREYIQIKHAQHVPIQSVIVTLNRLMDKGIIARHTLAPEEMKGRQRYLYTLQKPLKETRAHEVARVLNELVRDYYESNQEAALKEFTAILTS